MLDVVCSMIGYTIAFTWLTLLVTLNGVVWQEYFRVHGSVLRNWTDLFPLLITVMQTTGLFFLALMPFITAYLNRRSDEEAESIIKLEK